MSEDEKPAQLTKPALKKTHLRIVNSYDAAYLIDLSTYPGLGLAQLLSLPTDWIIAHWGIS